MIEVEGLSKRYGNKLAVAGVSFTVRPGIVTGFLGPNGAGKSTTMRLVLGLDAPTTGRALVNGRRYDEFPDPLHQVGALLEARAVHPGRSAFNHLLALALTHGLSKHRVHQVIEMTGLESVADRRVGGFSLGMTQRLGIATALLGDPDTLLLDEPVNGLDPEGVLWVRQLCRDLAGQGRTVFLSSHLMSEMAQTADHVIVLGRGRVLADAPIGDIVGVAPPVVRVRSPQAGPLADQLTGPGTTVIRVAESVLEVTGVTAAEVGDLAARLGSTIHELVQLSASLEDAYLALTRDEVEFRASTTPE